MDLYSLHALRGSLKLGQAAAARIRMSNLVRMTIATGLLLGGGMANASEPEVYRANVASSLSEKTQDIRHPPTAPDKTRKQSFKRETHKTQSRKNIEPTQSIETQNKPTKSVLPRNPGAKQLSNQADKDYTATSSEAVMGLQMLGEIEIKGRANDLQGIASSASQGQVSNDDFKYRPVARPGELIEVVPGMISTQHSGTGKANQYFLRGFNLVVIKLVD